MDCHNIKMLDMDIIGVNILNHSFNYSKLFVNDWSELPITPQQTHKNLLTLKLKK